MATTQFLGAFNDNVYKQTVLLLSVNVLTRWAVEPANFGPAPPGTHDLQGVAAALFAMPMVLFSGLAGYLADRFSKRSVVVACKVAEIGIMTLGTAALWLKSNYEMTYPIAIALYVVLFLMGTHTAFFGPSKYGILPELVPERSLPAANGIFLMTTFLAIIFGTALAGVLKQRLEGQLYFVGLVCIGIAIAGVVTSLLIRRIPPAMPELRFESDMYFVPRSIRGLLKEDRDLNKAVWASVVFWMSAAIVLLAVNSLGKRQLGLNDGWTSFLVSIVSIGIAVGSIWGAVASKGAFRPQLLRIGGIGLAISLVVISLYKPGNQHLIGFWGSCICLVFMGGFTGLFAVPLQVFLQARPPAELKGRMIAAQNWLQWLGIMLAGAVYEGTSPRLEKIGFPPCIAFLVPAIFMGAVAVAYRPPRGLRQPAS